MDIIVEVTEFDNLRNEYLQQEAAGQDYVAMLEAQLASEYQAYLAEAPAEAEAFLTEGRGLIDQLKVWAASPQHEADCACRREAVQLTLAEAQRQAFDLQEGDETWVYLAGDDHICLHFGSDTDNVRLVYMRDGLEECAREAVSRLREQRMARQREAFDTLQQMQRSLLDARHNDAPLDLRRIERAFTSYSLGTGPDYLGALVRRVSGRRTSRRGCSAQEAGIPAELDARYAAFVEALAQTTAPLLMTGNGRRPLFRWVLNITTGGRMTVAWDSYNSKTHLYSRTFDVASDDCRDALRAWWATSTMQEMKRLKELEQNYNQLYHNL